MLAQVILLPQYACWSTTAAVAAAAAAANTIIFQVAFKSGTHGYNPEP